MAGKRRRVDGRRSELRGHAPDRELVPRRGTLPLIPGVEVTGRTIDEEQRRRRCSRPRNAQPPGGRRRNHVGANPLPHP